MIPQKRDVISVCIGHAAMEPAQGMLDVSVVVKQCVQHADVGHPIASVACDNR
jgi:hypothetical protein